MYFMCSVLEQPIVLLGSSFCLHASHVLCYIIGVECICCDASCISTFYQSGNWHMLIRQSVQLQQKNKCKTNLSEIIEKNNVVK